MVDVGVYEPLPVKVHQKFFAPFNHVRRLGVHGDGSCFFHSVAACINFDNYHAHEGPDRRLIGLRLRKQIETHLVNGGEPRWKRFWRRRNLSRKALDRIPSYSKILETVKNTSAWAETHLIMYAMHKKKLNHIFIDATTNRIYCGVLSMDNPKQPLVMILWLNHSHFEPIVTTSQRSFSMSHPISQHVRTIFQRSPCPRITEDDVLKGAGKPIFRYMFDATVAKQDRRIIRGILSDPRTWNFTYVEDPDAPDVILCMWSNAKIKKDIGSKFKGLSVCMMGITPRVIIFNAANWQHTPKAFHGTITQYRQYLVNHEMGHAHGKGHVNAVAGTPCDVMYQQTKGAGGKDQCLVNPFPN